MAEFGQQAKNFGSRPKILEYLGTGSMTEDAARELRLDSLEAQYYRAVITRPWGERHLEGHGGDLWVGAGCRDVSAVISNTSVAVHAGLLATQVRLKLGKPAAAVQVWHLDPDTGTVTADVIEPARPLRVQLSEWTLAWDQEICEKVRRLRHAHLPAETGGILVGYFDNVTKRIQVVDALAAPADSEGDPTGFTRGIEGLAAEVREIQRRTANIVTNIGEWHSHPPNVPPMPSGADYKQLRYLAEEFERDGFPAVILIVGDDDETWWLGKVRRIA